MGALPDNANVLHARELEIRMEDGLVLASGRALILSVREYELLVALLTRAGTIVTREELYESVWGGELRPGDRSIDVYVSKLRGKLQAAVPDRSFIHTHPRFGYRFQPEPAAHASPGTERTTVQNPHGHPNAFTRCLHGDVQCLRDSTRASRGWARDQRRPHASPKASTSHPARGDPVNRNKIGALASVAALALALGLGACGSSSTSSSSSSTSSSSSASGTISGAGSTFAAPVYEQWASSLSPLTVNYQAVGSGAGITSLASKTVDFGASDPPLKPADFAALEKVGTPVQVPMFLGAITVSYNLPGVKSGLKLEGKTIANIFLGKIKTWNDPEITALNPGVTLPSTAITVIHRSDSSGTTAGFTSFLAAVDSEFKSKVGEGKDVQWPTGTGAKGNAGVAGAIQQTDGAVGYVEQAYALQHNFTYASVKNAAGNFVTPTLESTTAAGAKVVVPTNLGIKIVNPSGTNAYPLTSQTFIVVYKDMCKAGIPGGESAAKGVVSFLDYGLGSGQAVLAQADYAALPPSVLERSKTAVAGLECNGSHLSG